VADDLDALRTIRASAGDLDPERAARMRARALAGVFGEAAERDRTSDGAVLTQVHGDRRPADARAHPERPRRRDRADHVVRLEPDGPLAEIHLDPPDHPDGGDRTVVPLAGRSGRRPFLVVAAAAAIVAVVFGFAVARTGQRDTVVADQPAPTTVADIATNAASLVDRPLPAGEYAHLTIEEGLPFTDPMAGAQTRVEVTETWTSSAGDGRQRSAAPEIVDGTGRTVGTLGPASDTGPVARVGGFGAFTYDQLRSLPTDPTALRARLGDGSLAKASEASRSNLITDLLLLDVTPPGVRAAALTILAEDGATLRPEATDHEGRRGIGIELARSDGFTTVYVVDRDGVLVGAYDVAAGSPVEPDRAVSWTSPRDQLRVAGTG
jgi:hypothetical protein